MQERTVVLGSHISSLADVRHAQKENARIVAGVDASAVGIDKVSRVRRATTVPASLRLVRPSVVECAADRPLVGAAAAAG